MKMELMEDFYIEELKDILDAEKQLAKALPRMAGAATSPELKEAFELHAQETDGQIKRLQLIFKRLGEPADVSSGINERIPADSSNIWRL